MQALLCFLPAPSPESYAPHSNEHAQSRTAAALHPAVRPFLCGVRLHLARATTASRLAGSHAPALTAPTTPLVVGHQASARLPLPASDSNQRKLAVLPPSPRSRQVPPSRTLGLFPASPGGAPPLLARSVAEGSCR